MTSSFVHLNVKTAFNFNSTVRIPQLMKSVKQMGMKAVAMTDETTMYGMYDFYVEATKNGIKPIIGSVFRFQDEWEFDVVQLAKNDSGYKTIIRRSTDAQSQGVLQEKDFWQSEDVVTIVLMDSFFEKGQKKEAQQAIIHLSRDKSPHLYFGISDHGHAYQKEMNTFLADMKNELGIRLVAHNDVHYVEKEEKEAQRILAAIKTKQNADLLNGSHLKTPEEMSEQFARIPEAIENAGIIADMCEVNLVDGTEHFGSKLPAFPIPSDYQTHSNLKKMFTPVDGYSLPHDKEEVRRISYMCETAWKNMYRIYGSNNKEAIDRLRYEIGVMIYKKSTDYALIVADFMNYIKQHNIPSAKGRGSSPSSLLLRCLGVNDLDPLHYGLLFERFQNLERKDDPDIDLDVSQQRRFEVFQYAIDRYGKDHVAKICTFNNFGVIQTVRDAGEVLGIEANVLKELSKTVKQLGIKRIEDVKHAHVWPRLLEKDERLSDLVKVGCIIQTLPKNRSTHAAGLIISKQRLTEQLPLYPIKEDNIEQGMYGIQMANNRSQIENLGYPKIDFLALVVLDIIEGTKAEEGVKEIPLDDPSTFQLYKEGHTVGVFQMDSKPMQEISRDLAPSTVEELFPLIALYRPGSAEQIPLYIKNKQNNNRTMEGLEREQEIYPILAPTYGTIVYQEQIMKIVQVWAGYALGEADVLRRIISKKNQREMNLQEKAFVSRSVKNGRPEDVSRKIFELIKKFGNYGYNMPHATAYGLLGYECAYLKTHYPASYMAHLISLHSEEVDKASLYIYEAKRMGLDVARPNINRSTVMFEKMSSSSLSFGLAFVKNVGEKAASQVVSERENNGPYSSLQDFVHRMKHSSLTKGVNDGAIKALIKVGAFDCFGSRKNQLDQYKNINQGNVVFEQQYVFSDIPGFLDQEYMDDEDFSVEEKINMETALTGVALSAPSMESHRLYLESNKPGNDWDYGYLLSLEETVDKRKNKMAHLKVLVGNQPKKFVIFSSSWGRHQHLKGNNGMVYFKKSNHGNNVISDIHLANEPSKVWVNLPAYVSEMGVDEKKQWTKRLISLIKQHNGHEILVFSFPEGRVEYEVTVNTVFLDKLNQLIKDKTCVRVRKVQYH
ncbi:DNA polymerase III subunit alpha (plasmid) [Pontibacillus sp. ALD_SL1]|uniref:DNA polymerase III subunit alpha n=1 Tax=Pontibacillus sp. ALD_SL1 TaxID=2777185 RepID=UPI001A977656|nr:DNA polymerase III subunit alpha [Pontibacillus sp. ALD_SL1]QST03060.1 DNA polymerase III subunit alpha [Pontibacillus sp. ALD_SL1]